MSISEGKPGHSVVEIMITVVGIIVLIGLAVPAQRGLGVRANVAECVEAANTAHPSVDATLQRLGALPHCSDVRPGTDGSVVVTVRDTRASVPPVVQLAPSADAQHEPAWRCRQVSGDPRHMPAECRTAPARTQGSNPPTRNFPSALHQAER
ncbi:hypothetical protein [Alkalisalibacterium limincola]|uniref:Prepilin-type N-terminal cleavage/methylation domain-containing protein n=1 Tax=Alkalisalibacterium limincola TaxID=2699169 RepID=A0A5C8L0D3_9GAMM|nr:hypothetical protein [Alkalisalibacterium limincola]TXK65613.1 hypothetical protein FU658_00290 [Alkalisalibacterium limincola]